MLNLWKKLKKIWKRFKSAYKAIEIAFFAALAVVVWKLIMSPQIFLIVLAIVILLALTLNAVLEVKGFHGDVDINEPIIPIP